MNKTGRNEPCPCGNGKKYKQCCLRDNSASAFIKGAQTKLKQKVKQGLGKDIVFTEQQEIKMSEVVLEFAENILNRAKNDKQKEAAVGTACMAWNLALLDEAQRSQKLEKFCEELSKGDQQTKEDLNGVLTLLIKRKLTDYANINRFIAAYEFTKRGDHMHLDIASTII